MMHVQYFSDTQSPTPGRFRAKSKRQFKSAGSRAAISILEDGKPDYPDGLRPDRRARSLSAQRGGTSNAHAHVHAHACARARTPAHAHAL